MVQSGRLARELGLQPRPEEQSAVSATENPVVKLQQPKMMLDSGLISAQEYETKKADILSRM